MKISMKIEQDTKLKFAASFYQGRRLLATGCGIVALGLAGASAQVYVAPVYAVSSGGSPGFYLNSDAGPAFTQNFQSSRFGFPGSFSANPGVRFGIEPGYNFLVTDALTLGGEFETGLIYNRLSSGENAGFQTPSRGDLYQVPVLANLVLKISTGSLVVPYVGVGGGGDYSTVRFHTPGAFGFDTTSDQFNPAAQAIAGLRFRLNSAFEPGLGYKYLAYFPGQGASLGTHAVQASFSVKF
jgi:opacity protein-like surface antigen